MRLFLIVLLILVPSHVFAQAKGEHVPPFEYVNLDGTPGNLDTAQGKPIFINFWASWCGPCRVEMPDIERIYQEQKGDLVILAINVGETPEQARDYIAEGGFTFPVAVDENHALSEVFTINSYPTSLFISNNGTIMRRASGMLTYAEMQQGIELARIGDWPEDSFTKRMTTMLKTLDWQSRINGWEDPITGRSTDVVSFQLEGISTSQTVVISAFGGSSGGDSAPSPVFADRNIEFKIYSYYVGDLLMSSQGLDFATLLKLNREVPVGAFAIDDISERLIYVYNLSGAALTSPVLANVTQAMTLIIEAFEADYTN